MEIGIDFVQNYTGGNRGIPVSGSRSGTSEIRLLLSLCFERVHSDFCGMV